MIGYTMVGTNDYEKALAFYDALLAEIGGKRAMDFGQAIAYGFAKGPFFCVGKPYDGNTASTGNGVMTAFNTSSPEAVQKFHAKALELGAKCEGPPGPRGETGFYGAYVRDLDDNKLCAFCMG